MPSCRPTHTHTHPPCHLAARHRSEPCPPAPASRCTATLHFRCPAAVLMRKPAPERKPELKPGPDPPYGNAPPDRTIRRASTPVNNSRRSPPPTHTSAPPLDTSFPGSSPPDTAPQLHSAPKRASTPASSPATSPPDTPSHSNTPPNRRFRRAFSPANGARHHRPTPHHRTARSAFPSANNRRRSPPPTHTHTRSRPGTRISPGTRIQPKTIRPRRHAAPPPHAVARHLTVPLRQTHARTKKRSTLADASPLFGNVEFVTRPERNACRQLR